LLAALLATAVPVEGQRRGFEMVPESFPPYGITFRLYEAPRFPQSLRALGVATGYSIVVVTIDQAGAVTDAVGIEASDTAFIDAVLEVARGWIFAAAESATRPRREVLHYRFRLSGTVSVMNHREGAGSHFADAADDFPRVRTFAWDELDAKPTRLSDGAPNTAAPHAVHGTAELSFVIDTEGRVRVPVVLGASDADTSLIALAAVKQWRFSPPMKDGAPVLVEVRARWGD